MIRGTLLSCVALLAMSAGCSNSHGRNQAGGETHFMTACLDGTCEGGLSCVCGVCTRACTDDDACDALGGGALCREVKTETLLCEGPAAPEPRVCDSACFDADDCEGLGSMYDCVEGRCRPEAVADALSASRTDAGSAVEDAGSDAGCLGEACEDDVAPLVMILLDTSGSMERLTDCACETPSCVECLPECSPGSSQKNRWAEVLEVLTGTFDNFECEALERRAPDFTYDADYTFPYHRPIGEQRDDGLLRMYADRLRFGIATFDSVATYGPETQLTIDQFDFAISASEVGMWSYPAVLTSYRYPNCEATYYMNTGIRSVSASSGALIVEGQRRSREQTVRDIEATLKLARPFGSTPIAAALDDVYWLFANDPMMDAERTDTERRRHFILITDGQPDDDYRSVGCNCFADGDGSDCGGDPNIPSEMHCPYPLPEEAAWRLRCGDDPCATGLFTSVHVIGLALDGEITVERAHRMSRSGGSAEAIIAQDGAELRAELGALLADIESGRYDGGTEKPQRPSASGE